MCEICNCKTTDKNYQEEYEVGCDVPPTKKNSIEHSLNVLFDSLDRLKSLDDKISNIQTIMIADRKKSTFYFESLEALLNGLPDELYCTSARIDKLVENINAKLF